jgi:hypothetical protein
VPASPLLHGASAKAAGAGSQLYNTYGRAFAALQGVDLFGWTKSDPDAIHLVYGDASLKQLGQNILRPQIGQGRVVFDGPSLPPAAPTGADAAPWYDQAVSMIRSVAAFPGVDDYQYNWSAGTVTFHTTSATARDAYKALVRDQLGSASVSWTSPPATRRSR